MYKNTYSKYEYFRYILTPISLASFLWDIGKQNSPRCDAAERGAPSESILFAQRNFIEKYKKIHLIMLGESVHQICVKLICEGKKKQ